MSGAPIPPSGHLLNTGENFLEIVWDAAALLTTQRDPKELTVELIGLFDRLVANGQQANLHGTNPTDDAVHLSMAYPLLGVLIQAAQKIPANIPHLSQLMSRAENAAEEIIRTATLLKNSGETRGIVWSALNGGLNDERSPLKVAGKLALDRAREEPRGSLDLATAMLDHRPAEALDVLRNVALNHRSPRQIEAGLAFIFALDEAAQEEPLDLTAQRFKELKQVEDRLIKLCVTPNIGATHTLLAAYRKLTDINPSNRGRFGAEAVHPMIAETLQKVAIAAMRPSGKNPEMEMLGHALYLGNNGSPEGVFLTDANLLLADNMPREDRLLPALRLSCALMSSAASTATHADYQQFAAQRIEKMNFGPRGMGYSEYVAPAVTAITRYMGLAASGDAYQEYAEKLLGKLAADAQKQPAPAGGSLHATELFADAVMGALRASVGSPRHTEANLRNADAIAAAVIHLAANGQIAISGQQLDFAISRLVVDTASLPVDEARTNISRNPPAPRPESLLAARTRQHAEARAASWAKVKGGPYGTEVKRARETIAQLHAQAG